MALQKPDPQPLRNSVTSTHRYNRSTGRSTIERADGYRVKARRAFVAFTKKRKPGRKAVRRARRQQLGFVRRNFKAIDDRIVSISRPHVRPIKRGKAGRDTEFGAKLSINVVDGFSFVDRLSWDNYNEDTDLVDQIETFRRRFGFYPVSVHVDKIAE